MCNLYAIMRHRAEIAGMTRAFDFNNNQPPMPGVYPDYAAPVVLRGADGKREMRDLRWGLPSSDKARHEATLRRAHKLRAKGGDVDFAQLRRMEPDKGTTNVRRTESKHWARWLGPEHRCLVPASSFSEPDQMGGSLKPVWFALSEERPLFFFAGVHVKDWTSVRKVKTGEETCDVFGFLTTEANADVGRYHSKAMPVILTTEAERDLWMSDAPWLEVAHLQRPLVDGALQVVGIGERHDAAAPI